MSLGAYLATLGRAAQWGDSGELMAAAYVLGVPHAPGYPLLMLLGKAASLVPLGSVAVRMNLLNAALAAGAASLTSIVAGRVGCGRLGAILAGLTLAFSPVFWSLALAFEVYSLSALTLALLLLLALNWAEERRPERLFLFSFVYGLGMTTHLLIVAFAPAFLVFLWLVRRSAAQGEAGPATPDRRLVGCVACAVVGLALGAAIYLYLPVRARAEPPMNFGHPSNWANFLRVITGGPGKGQLFSSGAAAAFAQLASLARRTLAAFYWPGIVLAVVGAISLLLRRREVFALLALVVATDLTLAANIPVVDFEVYLIPSHMMIALLVGLGAEEVTAAIKGQRTVSLGPFQRPGQKRWVPVAAGALLLGLPLTQGWDNWSQLDSSKDRGAAQFADNFLGSVEPNALLVTDWSYAGPLFYGHFVEGKRSDVEVIPQFSKADPTLRLALLTDRVVNSRPVYAAEGLTDCIRDIRGKFLLLPMGRSGQRAYRVLDKDAPLPAGSERPPLRASWEAVPGSELLGFDLPSTTARQGGIARLSCYWRVTGGASPVRVVVSLDAEDKDVRAWRGSSTLLGIAAGRLKPGERLLLREDFIAWLSPDAPPGIYQFRILAGQGPAQPIRSISPPALRIRVLTWQNEDQGLNLKNHPLSRGGKGEQK